MSRWNNCASYALSSSCSLSFGQVGSAMSPRVQVIRARHWDRTIHSCSLCIVLCCSQPAEGSILPGRGAAGRGSGRGRGGRWRAEPTTCPPEAPACTHLQKKQPQLCRLKRERASAQNVAALAQLTSPVLVLLQHVSHVNRWNTLQPR